jgi:hypothetical protein
MGLKRKHLFVTKYSSLNTRSFAITFSTRTSRPSLYLRAVCFLLPTLFPPRPIFLPESLGMLPRTCSSVFSTGIRLSLDSDPIELVASLIILQTLVQRLAVGKLNRLNRLLVGQQLVDDISDLVEGRSAMTYVQCDE